MEPSVICGGFFIFILMWKQKLLLGIFFMLLFSRAAFAQDFLKDAAGRPIISGVYSDVSGSPYLYTDFVKGTIQLADGRSYTNVFLNLDLISQEVLFLKQDNEKMAFKEDVRGVVFEPATGRALFKRNFPSSNSSTNKDFFLVLADGKMTLLKKIWKVIWQEKEFNSATLKKNILDKSAYFIFDAEKNTMVQTKINKKTLSTIFVLHQEAMDKYIKTEKIDPGKDEDLVKLFTYYNSL